MAPDDPARSTPPGWEEWLRAELEGLEASALRAHRIAVWRHRLLVTLAVLGGAALIVLLALLPRSAELRRTPVPPGPAAATGSPHASAGPTSPPSSCCPSNLPGGCPNCWTAGR
ncbi:hypothetical protein [Kitasatospora arboriphila]|uniref:Uncharacterized protein n=1 Tax=Kitasatospora arboriphila TaxID=258052 RepID=A0ABN1U4M9_9ACTN